MTTKIEALPTTIQTWTPNWLVRNHNAGIQRIGCEWLMVTQGSVVIGDIAKVALFAIGQVALAMYDVAKGTFALLCCCNKGTPAQPADKKSEEPPKQGFLIQADLEIALAPLRQAMEKNCSEQNRTNALFSTSLSEHFRAIEAIQGQFRVLDGEIKTSFSKVNADYERLARQAGSLEPRTLTAHQIVARSANAGLTNLATQLVDSSSNSTTTSSSSTSSVTPAPVATSTTSSTSTSPATITIPAPKKRRGLFNHTKI